MQIQNVGNQLGVKDFTYSNDIYHPMQILVNFETEGKCILQRLSDTLL